MLYDLMQKGGPVMYPLLICSVIALTVVTERFLFWMRLKTDQDTKGVQSVLELVHKQRTGEALERARGLKDPVARVLARGLEHWPTEVTSALEVQLKEELIPLQRYLGILETTITLAPLLGIYGTITGIIRAFGFLSRAGLADPSGVASGIAEALITTAAGLTIAIVSIPAYNFFSAKAQEVLHDIEREATALELLANRCVFS